MKKIYNALVLGVTLMLLSCYNNEGVELPINENIIIDLSASVTRAEDTSTESYVNHIDIFVFEDEAGAPAALAHYERQQLNNSRTLTLNANRSSFAADEAYYVYLVANSNIAEATFSALADYNALLNTKQEDPMVYLSGLDDENFPKYFLMDAVAMNAAMVLHSRQPCAAQLPRLLCASRRAKMWYSRASRHRMARRAVSTTSTTFLMMHSC